MRSRFLAEVKPLVETFARELADLLEAQFGAEVERVREAAVQQLAAAFDGPVVERDLKPAKRTPQRKAKRSRPAPAPEPVQRKPRACSRCGQAGHTARTCHDLEVEDVEAEQAPTPGPTVDAARAERWRKIEASANARRAQGAS